MDFRIHVIMHNGDFRTRIIASISLITSSVSSTCVVAYCVKQILIHYVLALGDLNSPCVTNTTEY